MRLLIAVGAALQGPIWETQMSDAATEIQKLLRSGISGTDLSDAVLNVTDDLRHAIAADL